MKYGIYNIGNLKKGINQSLNRRHPDGCLLSWEKEMIKYTTPVLGLLVENRDLTGNDIYVSLEQGQAEATF